MTAPAPPRRRRSGFLLRLLVTAALLAGVLALLPREEIAVAIRRVPPGLWVLTAVGFLAGHTVAALKWSLLLAACGVRPGAGTVLRAHGAGLFANLFLPSLVGGDLVRAGLAARAARGLEPVAVATLADRALDTAALLALIAAAAPFVGPARTQGLGALPVVLAAGLLALAVGAVVLRALLRRPERLPAALQQPARRVAEAFAALARQPARSAGAGLLALGVQAAFVLLNLRLGQAIGLPLSPAAWFFVWPLAKIAAMVPVSLGGIGVREVAFAALVAPFAVGASLAVGQALVWDSVLLAGGLTAGALALGLPSAAGSKGDEVVDGADAPADHRSGQGTVDEADH